MGSPGLACTRLRSPAVVCTWLEPACARLLSHTLYHFSHDTFIIYGTTHIIYYFRYHRISTYTPALVVIPILSSSDPC